MYIANAEAPLERVWEALQRPDTWASIGGIDQVFGEATDDQGLAGYGFELTVGGRRYRGNARRTSAEPERSIVMHLEISEMTGELEVILAPDGGHTKVQVSLTVESKGLLAAAFFPMIAGGIGAGLPGNVEAFVKRLA
jgi:carbon monoxide dehydrogenase subunit G